MTYINKLFTGTANKSINATQGEISTFPTGKGTNIVPGGFLQPTQHVSLSGGGVFSTQTLTPPSVTIKIKMGSTVLASVTIGNLLANASNNGFQFDAVITCRTIGATGTVVVDGQLSYATGVLTRGFADLVNASPVTVDTTVDQAVDVTVTWSTGSASNSMTITRSTIGI